MKNSICILLVLSATLIGCGSVDSNAPSLLNGSWYGTIQENGPYLTTAYIYAEDNAVNGYAVVTRRDVGVDWYFDIYGTAYGTERAFGLNLQFSDESYDKWVFTGYVQNYRLCLSFEARQQHCLEPVSGPPGTFDVRY